MRDRQDKKAQKLILLYPGHFQHIQYMFCWTLEGFSKQNHNGSKSLKSVQDFWVYIKTITT